MAYPIVKMYLSSRAINNPWGNNFAFFKVDPKANVRSF